MSYNSNIIRLPDPTTQPRGPGFTAVNLLNNVHGTTSALNNGGSISVKTIGSYWTFTITYPELSIDEMGTIGPLLDFLSDGFEDVYVQLPQYINPATGPWNLSSPTLSATGAITLVTPNTISIPNWSSRGGDLNPGDMLKFTNSNKIYKVVFASLNGNTKRMTLSSDVISAPTINSAGLAPNDIKIKAIVTSYGGSALTARGVYEPFSVEFRENIL